MNRRLRTVLFLALALLALRAQADIIVLLDGTTIEGEIIEEDDDKVKIKGRFGTTEIKRREIREITKETSKRAAFLEKYDGLDKGASADDPESWMTLGYWAKREGLREEANKAFARALQINPNHEQAHQNLGHVRYLGKWITAEEHRQLTSGGGNDAAPPAAGGNNVPRPVNNTPPPSSDVQALTGTTEKGTGSSKRVKCPDCNGDGITGWFTCKQCKRSPQAGYVYYGERMEKCPTCHGAAKLPGVPCRRCNRSGIVDPEKPVTPFGKFIPPGLELCSDCGGEGYKTWNECNQCKRSEHPGYLDMNGVIQMCNRCHGLGKMPGVRCDKCGTSGMTRKK